MKIGDEVFVHGYVDEIRNDVVIIRNVGGYFGTSRDEVFYYEEDERGYGTMNEADRKTENSLEKPNTCDTCRFELYCPEMCEGCCEWDSHYEPKDEPQTDGYMTAEQTEDYRKMLDKAEHKVYGNIEDEPQTEREGE